MSRMSRLGEKIRCWLKGWPKINENLPHDQIIIHGRELTRYVNQYLFINVKFESESDNETRPFEYDPFELTLALDIVTLIQSSLSAISDVVDCQSSAWHAIMGDWYREVNPGHAAWIVALPYVLASLGMLSTRLILMLERPTLNLAQLSNEVLLPTRISSQIVNMIVLGGAAQRTEALKKSERFVSQMERWVVRFSRLYKWIPPLVGVFGSIVAGFYMLRAHHRSFIGVLCSMVYGLKEFLWVLRAYGYANSVIVLPILTKMSLCHRMKMAARHLTRPSNKATEVMACVSLVSRLNDQVCSSTNQSIILCFGSCLIHTILSIVTGKESLAICALFICCEIWILFMINAPFHLSQAIINEVRWLVIDVFGFMIQIVNCLLMIFYTGDQDSKNCLFATP